MGNDGEIKYVSWRALVTTVVSVLGVVLVDMFFAINSFNSALDKKLDKAVFEMSVHQVAEGTVILSDRMNRANERARRMEILVERIATKLNISSYVPELPPEYSK